MSDVNHAVRTPQSGAGAPRTGGASLAGLLLALAAGGWLLYRLSGRPRLPRSSPAPEAIWQALQRPDLPLDAALPVLAALAWALWLWLVVSVVLRLAVLAADGLTQGAAWVGALRRLSDRLTLPVVRRVIDGAVVAGVVVSLAGRASPAAAAAIEDVPASVTYQAPPPAPPHSGPPEPADPEPALPAVPSTPAQRIAGQPAPPDVDDQAPPQVAVYRVKAGDNLWHIAERYYGSGEAFPLLVEANAGRRMPDGRTFTRSGVIHPGWELHIPLPADILEEADGQTYYVVQPGDTLQGIASRLLGSADAWPAIFTANRGVASLPDGRILRDPDVIWPGLRLKVAQPAHAEVKVAAPPAAAEAPAPQEPGPPEPGPPEPGPPEPGPPEPAVPQDSVPAEAPPTAKDGPPPADQAPLIEMPSAPAAAAGGAATAGEPAPAVGAGAPARQAPRLQREVAVGAALLASGGVAATLAWRARGRRRRLSEPPAAAPTPYQESGEVVLAGGFAEVEPNRALVHRLQGSEVEAAVIVAAQLQRLLRESLPPQAPGSGKADDVAVLTVLQARATTGRTFELTLRTTLAAQPRLLALAPTLGARLGGSGQAEPLAGGDVRFSLSEVRSFGLLPPPLPLTPDAATGVTLLPVGAPSSHQVLYANWRELEHVLVAGGLAGSTTTVLTSLVATLAARQRPDELQVWTVGRQPALPRELLALPHQMGAPLDPHDEGRLAQLLQTVRTEVVRRLRRADGEGPPGPGAPGTDPATVPELVVLIPELAEAGSDGQAESLRQLLYTVAADGPGLGIRVLAATSQPEAIDQELLSLFATRLVLQLPDEAQSIRLLGRPDAATLGGGGQLLFSLAGRPPLPLCGFRLAPERLAELVRLLSASTIRSDSGSGAESSAAPPPMPASPEGSAPDVRAAAGGESLPPIHGTQGVVIHGTQREEPHRPEGDGPGHGAAGGVAAPAPPPDEEPGRPADPAPDQRGPGAGAGAVAADSAAAAPSVTIEIRCFGGFEVHCGQRRLSATGNAGPRHRSWEILAFLAAQPAELVATDKLLAAMWPESDADKAASAFGAALSRLRRLLADQLGESPGPVVHRDRVGRTCRLDPLVFVSDVHRFVRLSREARRMPAEEAISAYEQARRLYQGDLLRDQPYAWLHERDDDGLTLPERHRETYRLITYELAELYLQSGQVERAVPLYKSLLKAEPTLEDVARRLYRCYGLLGDRVSLLREHRQLQQALREAYGPEDDEAEAAEAHDPQTEAWLASPEPETIAVYEAVLATLDQQHAGASGQPNGTAAAPDGTSGASGATGARGHDGGAVPYANGVAAPATHAAHRPRGESTPDPAGPAGTGQVMDPLSRPARTET